MTRGCGITCVERRPVRLDERMSVHDVARRLPCISPLNDLCRSLAMLDAILCPEWDHRWHGFDAHWSPTEAMASMRDGSGGEYSLVFSAAGVYARGFDLEAVRHVYALRPLTDEVIAALAPERVPAELAEDIKEIGYPSGAGAGAVG